MDVRERSQARMGTSCADMRFQRKILIANHKLQTVVVHRIDAERVGLEAWVIDGEDFLRHWLLRRFDIRPAALRGELPLCLRRRPKRIALSCRP